MRSADRMPGLLTDNFPADCLVEDCLIHAQWPVREADRAGGG